MESFDKALAFTLLYEGGYSNHPSDSGKGTMKGITQATYDAYRTRKKLSKRDVRLLTDVELKDIYKTGYWLASGADKLPEKLAIAVFDCSVNLGISQATKLLQNIVGSTVDGKPGAKTLNDILYYISKHGESKLLKAYLDARKAKYHQYASKGSQRVFLAGWLNRLNNLRSFLGSA